MVKSRNTSFYVHFSTKLENTNWTLNFGDCDHVLYQLSFDNMVNIGGKGYASIHQCKESKLFKAQ